MHSPHFLFCHYSLHLYKSKEGTVPDKGCILSLHAHLLKHLDLSHCSFKYLMKKHQQFFSSLAQLFGRNGLQTDNIVLLCFIAYWFVSWHLGRTNSLVELLTVIANNKEWACKVQSLGDFIKTHTIHFCFYKVI